MEKLKQKLLSRKLWVAIVGVVVGLAAAFGIGENDYAQVAGVVTSAISVFTYILGEVALDSLRQTYGVDLPGFLEEIRNLEEKETVEKEETTTKEG